MGIFCNVPHVFRFVSQWAVNHDTDFSWYQIFKRRYCDLMEGPLNVLEYKSRSYESFGCSFRGRWQIHQLAFCIFDCYDLSLFKWKMMITINKPLLILYWMYLKFNLGTGCCPGMRRISRLCWNIFFNGTCQLILDSFFFEKIILWILFWG